MIGANSKDLREVFRYEMVMRDRIAEVLGSGPKTVPEIAEELGVPASQVMIWIMGMRRYGQVTELHQPNDEGYYQYALAGSEK